MKILLNIIVTFVVIPWGGFVIMSPMMIAAKDFATTKSSIIGAMLFFAYPVFVFLLLKITGYRFYGTDPLTWAISFFVLASLVILAYGLPRQLLNVANGISNYDYFFKDNKVYLNGRLLKGADANTFTHFEDRGYYSKDKNNVYYNNKILKGADAATFKPLANDEHYSYWHDKNDAYYKWLKISNADGASLEYLGQEYSKDKKHVYFQDKCIEKADVNSFEYLTTYTGRDKNNVFVRTAIANKIVDKESFEIITINEEKFGKDKEHIYAIFYVEDHPIVPFPNADIATFEVLGEYYAKDKNQVYYYSYHINKILVLEEANAQTFRLEYNGDRNTNATDGEHYYRSGILYSEENQ